MLTLTRRPNECIIIETPSGEVIKVCPLRINGNQVSFGVEADREVSIDREEIWERKQAERKAS